MLQDAIGFSVPFNFSLAVEGLVTTFTSEQGMSFHVSSQFGTLGCCVVTNCATVRFFPRMGPPVHRQVGMVYKNFATKLTSLVGSLHGTA